MPEPTRVVHTQGRWLSGPDIQTETMPMPGGGGTRSLRMTVRMPVGTLSALVSRLSGATPHGPLSSLAHAAVPATDSPAMQHPAGCPRTPAVPPRGTQALGHRAHVCRYILVHPVVCVSVRNVLGGLVSKDCNASEGSCRALEAESGRETCGFNHQLAYPLFACLMRVPVPCVLCDTRFEFAVCIDVNAASFLYLCVDVSYPEQVRVGQTASAQTGVAHGQPPWVDDPFHYSLLAPSLIRHITQTQVPPLYRFPS